MTMAWCPFAVRDFVGNSGGIPAAGVPKIVHHKTQGGSYAGARSVYLRGAIEPHFTVTATHIYQHIDTHRSAYALENPAGGVETNRAGNVIQIEFVGYSGQEDLATARQVARLCRWIEGVHNIPKGVWPNGEPRPTDQNLYGVHSGRNPTNWVQKSGHYPHSRVPENSHWDPAYTPGELAIINEGGAVVALSRADKRLLGKWEKDTRRYITRVVTKLFEDENTRDQARFEALREEIRKVGKA